MTGDWKVPFGVRIPDLICCSLYPVKTPFFFGSYSIVVSTSRCGRDILGSNPSSCTFVKKKGCTFQTSKSTFQKRLTIPGLEPGTFSTSRRRDDRYTIPSIFPRRDLNPGLSGAPHAAGARMRADYPDHLDYMGSLNCAGSGRFDLQLYSQGKVAKSTVT